MKYLLTSLITLSLCANMFAQTDVLDSLRREVQKYEQLPSTTMHDDTLAVNNLLRLSEGFQKLSIDSALHYGKKAQTLAEKSKWVKGLKNAAYLLGNAHYMVTYDFESAIPYYQDAILHAKQLFPDQQGGDDACRYYYYISNCYSYQGKYQEATNAILTSKAVAQHIGSKNWELNAFNVLGSISRNLNEYEKSKEYYEQCLAIIKEIKSERLEAVLYGNLALSYNGLSEYQTAIKYFNKAIAIDSTLGIENGLIRHYTNKGTSYRYLGELDRSIDELKKAKSIALKLNNQYSLANALTSMAIIYNMKGDYNQAIALNKKGIAIYEQFKDLQSVANTMANIGIDYQFSGQLLVALDYHNRANRMIEENGLVNSGASLGNMALIYGQTGNHEKALALQMEVLELSEKTNLRSNKALCLANIGKIYFNMKKYKEAEKYYQLAYDLSSELELNSTKANCLSDLGTLKLEEGDFVQALSYFNQVIAQYEAMDAKYNLAVGYANICQANVRAGNYAEAIKAGEKGMKNAIAIGNPSALRQASKTLYNAHYQNNSKEEALVYVSFLRKQLSNELEINYLGFSEKERENYFLSMENDLGNYYDFGLNHITLYPAISDTMYNMALRNKGLSLKSSTFIRQSILNSGDSTLIKEYDNFIINKKKAASNYSKGIADRKLEELLSQQERSLVEKSGVFSDFNTLKNIDWKEVRDNLDSDQAAIEFINFQSEIDSAKRTIYAAMIVKKDSEHPKIVQLCSEDELEQLLKQNGEDSKMVEKIYEEVKSSKNVLYQKIWKPLEPELKGVKEIFYSPSGLLHKISFAAISNDDRLLLCDNFKLNQQSSTGKIVESIDLGFNKKDRFMLVGGVQYNSSSSEKEIWSYLPGTEREVKSISNYLKKKNLNIDQLAGNQAKETLLKERARDANILHIATHGFFFPDPKAATNIDKDDVSIVENMNFRGMNGIDSLSRNSTSYLNWNFVNNGNPLMRSGLVLAGANDVWQRDPLKEGDDGVLTAQEVSNLNLVNTKLVVLSACETGLGDIKGSEGVFGLQRAIKMAGADYLVMSLWQVPDKETAEFMELFYQNLTKLKDIRETFQVTQQTMRKKYDPYFWAAFVLIN